MKSRSQCCDQANLSLFAAAPGHTHNQWPVAAILNIDKKKREVVLGKEVLLPGTQLLMECDWLGRVYMYITAAILLNV